MRTRTWHQLSDVVGHYLHPACRVARHGLEGNIHAGSSPASLLCVATPTSPTCQINTFTYNDFRREAVQVNERGFDRHFFFDEWGNPIKIVEENGAEHTYTYDTLSGKPYNRLTKKDPLGYVTSYAYDALGNVTTITTPRLATITFGPFNPFNQPQVMKDARGNYTVMKYDVNGNLLEEIKLRAGAPAPASVGCAQRTRIVA